MNRFLVCHPQTNGQVESTNKNILNSLKKRLDDAKGLWVKELPSTLWAIRTTAHSKTRDTSFNLTFRTDAVILVEIDINTLRVSHYDSQQNKANLNANLDLLEEIKEDASVKAVARQRSVAQHFNKQVKARLFEEGDLVLRNCQANRPVGEQRKLSPTWEGPYLISSVIGKGACRLQTIDGKEIPNTWNAQHLMKYYC